MKTVRVFSLFILFGALFSAQPASAASSAMAKILNILDGSTLQVEVRGASTLVHLMGVATPSATDESKPILKRLGLEGMAFLKETTKSGWVYLEYPAGDVPQTANAPVDVVMFGGKDSAMINETLIREGFGVVNRKVATPINDQLLKAEATAKASQNGIWGEFEHGDGQSVASGRANQGTYIGQVNQTPQRGYVPAYVNIWIVSFR